jgi:ribosomal protein L35
MKTNKAYRKRIRVTKKGKVLARSKGQNHFNAKESRSAQYAKAKYTLVQWSNRIKRRFLSGV